MVHVTSSCYLYKKKAVVIYSGIFISVTQQRKSELDCLIVEVRMSHVIRHTHTHNRQDSSGIAIHPMQRPLPHNT